MADFKVNLLSWRGTDNITPLPVPIHKRLHEMANAVMRTNENPNLPVPAMILKKELANNFKKSQNMDKKIHKGNKYYTMVDNIA